MSEGNQPYRLLGWHLKLAREQLSESIAEVSGAVEIDTESLEQFEKGKSRPSEDVLLLLISHLGLADAEANSLWELAGYAPDNKSDDTNKNLDLRIIYTDMVHVVINDVGVVMNFMQASGLGNQPLAVSRVGMSKDQAKHMLNLLQQSLNQSPETKPKLLTSDNNKSNQTNKKSTNRSDKHKS